MTVQFHSNIRNLIVGRGLSLGFTSPCAISIFGGARPTAAQITSSWASYNTSNPNFLAHYLGATWTNPNGGTVLTLTTIPAAVNALNTGTGVWAILWATNISGASVAGSTLPSTQFIVVDVSEFAGTGVIKFTSAEFTSGVSKAILLGNINVTSS
jgi:hypothetical protein